MYAQAKKSKQNKIRVLTNPTRSIKSQENFHLGFVDYRTEMIAQRKFQKVVNNDLPTNQVTQRQNMASHYAPHQHQAIRVKRNYTGLPDSLKSGIETLSGYSMDDVKVHYNSTKPAQLNAHAYTQGTDIYIAPGQEQHLPHEAWHVVQQKQGRVQPTMQLQNVNINDDHRLEKEADMMGTKAIKMEPKVHKNKTSTNIFAQGKSKYQWH